MTSIKIQHSSLDAFNTDAQHNHDSKAVWSRGNDLVTGTEAGANGLHASLPDDARAAGYHCLVGHTDSWIGVSKDFGTITDNGFDVAIPSLGRPAKGAHTARGVFWAEVTPHDKTIGLVYIETAHFLTVNSMSHNGDTNHDLQKAFGAFARERGQGAAIVFASGDTNLQDNRVDVFDGLAPLTTCWDELGKHPVTHPHPHGPRGGTTIDVIASYDHDHRVSCASAHALTDADFRLASDHFTIEAEYHVASRQH